MAKPIYLTYFVLSVSLGDEKEVYMKKQAKSVRPKNRVETGRSVRRSTPSRTKRRKSAKTKASLVGSAIGCWYLRTWWAIDTGP